MADETLQAFQLGASLYDRAQTQRRMMEQLQVQTADQLMRQRQADLQNKIQSNAYSQALQEQEAQPPAFETKDKRGQRRKLPHYCMSWLAVCWLACCLLVGLPAGAWRMDGARTEKAHQASVGFFKRSKDSLNKGASPLVYPPLQSEACSAALFFRT